MIKCSKCETILEKHHADFNSKKMISNVVMGWCPKCHRYEESNQYDVKK